MRRNGVSPVDGGSLVVGRLWLVLASELLQNAVSEKAGRTREKPDGNQNPAERR